MATTITANGINFPDGSAGSPSIGGTDTNTGLFTGSDIIGFSTGGNERLRIDSSGNVGIGTTAPSELFTVNGADKSALIRTSNAVGTAKLKFEADGTNYGGVGLENTAIVFRCSNNSSPTERLRIDSGGSVRVGDNSINIAGVGTGPTFAVNGSAPEITLRDSATGNPYAWIATDDAGSLNLAADQGNNASSSVIKFRVDGTERMRIDSSGNVGIGTTSATASTAIFGGTQNCLMVAGSAAPQIRIASDTSNQGDLLLIAGNSGADCVIANAANNGDLLFSTNSSGAQGTRFKIDDSGKCFMPEVFNRTSGSAVNMRVDSDGELRRSTSSKRYKKCITDAPWGLAEVLKLKPITYKSNASGKDANDKIFGGFTAEDVHDIGLTEFVDYNDDNEPDAIAYGNMVSLATKAIQELTSKVETLETKVAALEAA